MNWLALLRAAAPVVIAALLGAGAAWNFQGVRLDAARNGLAAYQNGIREAVVAAREHEQTINKESSDAWKRNMEALRADQDAFKRCVAAGRCGVRVVTASCPADAASPAGRTDGAGGGAIPVDPRDAAQDRETAIGGLIEDCRKVQLRLNLLQENIEAQRGY